MLFRNGGSIGDTGLRNCRARRRLTVAEHAVAVELIAACAAHGYEIDGEACGKRIAVADDKVLRGSSGRGKAFDGICFAVFGIVEVRASDSRSRLYFHFINADIRISVRKRHLRGGESFRFRRPVRQSDTRHIAVCRVDRIPGEVVVCFAVQLKVIVPAYDRRIENVNGFFCRPRGEVIARLIHGHHLHVVGTPGRQSVILRVGDHRALRNTVDADTIVFGTFDRIPFDDAVLHDEFFNCIEIVEIFRNGFRIVGRGIVAERLDRDVEVAVFGVVVHRIARNGGNFSVYVNFIRGGVALPGERRTVVAHIGGRGVDIHVLFFAPEGIEGAIPRNDRFYLDAVAAFGEIGIARIGDIVCKHIAVDADLIGVRPADGVPRNGAVVGNIYRLNGCQRLERDGSRFLRFAQNRADGHVERFAVRLIVICGGIGSGRFGIADLHHVVLGAVYLVPCDISTVVGDVFRCFEQDFLNFAA